MRAGENELRLVVEQVSRTGRAGHVQARSTDLGLRREGQVPFGAEWIFHGNEAAGAAPTSQQSTPAPRDNAPARYPLLEAEKIPALVTYFFMSKSSNMG